jgi:Vacuolar protein sorting-associated protein 62
MKPSTARAAAWSTVLGTLSFFGIIHHLHSENAERTSWVARSSSWLDRTACNWIGVCGASHLRTSKSTSTSESHEAWRKKPLDAARYWTSGTEDESSWGPEERRLREIPQYVLDHAPYVHLYSGEEYWPCDIADHLVHTTPHFNYDPVEEDLRYPNLESLEELNSYGKAIFLQSDDNVEDYPDWLGGESNIPSGPRLNHAYQQRPDYYEGKKGWTLGLNQERLSADNEREKWINVADDALQTKEEFRTTGNSSSNMRSKETESAGGRSDAPAVLVVVDKGDDVVDAFWFYFYSFNLGNTFFSVRFGNHIGDWEHMAIRFHKGRPKLVFFSEHSWGEAYEWEAVEKIGNRVSAHLA